MVNNYKRENGNFSEKFQHDQPNQTIKVNITSNETNHNVHLS